MKSPVEGGLSLLWRSEFLLQRNMVDQMICITIKSLSKLFYLGLPRIPGIKNKITWGPSQRDFSFPWDNKGSKFELATTDQYILPGNFFVYSGQILIYDLVKFFLLIHLSKQQGEWKITKFIFKRQRKPPIFFILFEFAFASKMDISIVFSHTKKNYRTLCFSQNLTEVLRVTQKI